MSSRNAPTRVSEARRVVRDRGDRRMAALDNLARLRVEDPTAAAAVVDSLWTVLAHEDPKLFAALWRKANKASKRPAIEVQVPKVEWLDEPAPVAAAPIEVAPVAVAAQRLPAVDLMPAVQPIAEQPHVVTLPDVAAEPI